MDIVGWIIVWKPRDKSNIYIDIVGIADEQQAVDHIKRVYGYVPVEVERTKPIHKDQSFPINIVSEPYLDF